MLSNGPHALDERLTRSILERMVTGVTSCELQNSPFPHFVFSSFVPNDVYASLLTELPNKECYEPFGYERHHNDTGDSNRFRFSLNRQSLDRLSSEQQRLWYAVRYAFGSKELKTAVFKKLAPGLRIRYGKAIKNAAELPGFALPELFRETDGYSIRGQETNAHHIELTGDRGVDHVKAR